jgi:hypothetical protein
MRKLIVSEFLTLDGRCKRRATPTRIAAEDSLKAAGSSP